MTAQLDEAIALAERVQAGNTRGIAAIERLKLLLETLPPQPAQVMTRPHWQRAALIHYAASFESVPNVGEPPSQNVEIQINGWLRSINAQVYVQFDQAAATSLIPLLFRWGSNNRWAAEANFRLNDRQGFQTTGHSEIFEPLERLTGDGSFPVPLDWNVLEKGDTIEVRLRSLLGDIFNAGELATVGIVGIRWAVISFGVEPLDHPSFKR